MSEVEIEYRCSSCGAVAWEKSPLRPLRGFLRHFCDDLGSYTVMRGIEPQGVLESWNVDEADNEEPA